MAQIAHFSGGDSRSVSANLLRRNESIPRVIIGKTRNRRSDCCSEIGKCSKQVSALHTQDAAFSSTTFLGSFSISTSTCFRSNSSSFFGVRRLA